MNNDILILRVLKELLLSPNTKERLLLATEITRVLNPKEDVPYEKSLEENAYLQIGEDCKLCGTKGICHEMLGYHRLGKCVERGS